MVPAPKFTQPSLADLTARFVSRPMEPDSDAAVAPHEMPSSFAIEPLTAWSEACAVLTAFGSAEKPGKMPTDWSHYVRQSADADFLPMALGHFPQQVRDVSALLARRAVAAPSEPRGWTAGTAAFLDRLHAAAAARAARRFDDAERWLDSTADETDPARRALVANERAALAWHCGDRAAAARIWNESPASAPIHFNRGLAALVAGNNAVAAENFALAATLLPDTSGWHHLADLYRALAD
jgi:hypothetical protein